MNAREEWPAPQETPSWWLDRPLTPEQMDAMAAEYQAEQIASAQSDTGTVDAAGTYIGESK